MQDYLLLALNVFDSGLPAAVPGIANYTVPGKVVMHNGEWNGRVCTDAFTHSKANCFRKLTFYPAANIESDTVPAAAAKQ